MSKFYACILAMWLCVHFTAFAQTATISLSYDNSSNICINSTYRLGITTTGTFGADNKFSVQIRKSEYSSTVTDVPAVLVNGRLEFTLKDSANFAGSYVQFRAIASSPKTESVWSGSIQMYTKGRIILNPENKTDTLNAFDNASILFGWNSVGDARVTLNDSTRLNLSSYSIPSSAQHTVTIPDNFPGYTIAHAENNCGAMQVSGTYRPVINATSIKIAGVTPSAICEGSDVRVSFSTAGTPFTAQTRYRLRFTEVYYSSNAPITVETPATLTNGVLVATFPTQLQIKTNKEFTVRIITDNPATLSSGPAVQVSLWPKTGATFNTSSQTLTQFGPASLGINTTGLPPMTVELTDGTKSTSGYGTIDIPIFPITDQEYRIKSVTSGCGTVEITNPETVRIKVKPGIRIYEGNTAQTLCSGSNARLRFVTSAAITDATKFTVQVYNGYTSQYETYNATRSGEYLEFALPNRTGGTSYTFQIYTTNPAMSSQIASVNVQTMPNLTYASRQNTFVFKLPTKVQIGYEFEGGGPFTVEAQDGTVKTYDSNVYDVEQLFVRESMDYKIKSIANGCFKNTNPRNVRLTVSPSSEPGIYLEPLKTAICSDDSLEITFGTVGQFTAGNRFSIQTNAPCCNFQALRVVEKEGKYKIKLSIQALSAIETDIRIASTNPVLFSNEEHIRLQSPLTQFYLYPQAKAEEPWRYVASPSPGWGQILSLSANSQFQSIVYTENGVERTATFNQYNSSIPTNPKTGELSTYIVKSATNACGTYPVDLATYIQAMPYRIQFSQYNTPNYCADAPLSIPFGIVEGKSDNATFTLQIARSGSSEYQTIITGEKGSIIKTTVPKGMEPGYYNIRLLSSEGSISDPLGVQISTPPTAILTPGNSQPNPIRIDAGSGISLQVKTTGTAPISTVFSDNTRQEFYTGDQSWYTYPLKSQEYSIRSVSNVCGYGTGSGAVNVIVNPKLSLYSPSGSVCEGGTVTVSYELNGDVDLSNEYIRFGISDQASSNVIMLDSTRSLKGIKNLTMPNSLPGSYYRIICTVEKYKIQSTLSVYVTTKPSVTLLGNTVINAGESTTLVIRSNKSTPDVNKFVLSDGSKGEVYSSGTAQVTVSPQKTTTYTISSVTNGCGNGTTTGSATVEVNPPSERSITVTTITSSSGYGLCTGDTIAIGYKTAGSFSAGNQFTVQLSDTTGRNFRAITTIPGSNPIKAVMPTDLVAGILYRIRVVASDANTASSAYASPMNVSQKARAKFASETVIFDGVKNPKVTVLLSGGGPWYYQFGTDANVINRQSSVPTDVVELFQASPSQYYRLFRVSNSCGNGIIDSPSIVKVEIVTATEPHVSVYQATVAPNPAQDVLAIRSEDGTEKSIRLISQNGNVVRTIKTRKREETLDIRDLSPGIYLLHIDAKGRKATFKVIKQ
ncbi:hypothetical protein GCM10007423_41150 [Dyadobacter endophyticus]|uniref:Secretion system C-terminal sorting domain-containing protein n=1 Tax=Dyadobacter endophyticus TaxID=1749036 RepID=A0ABQ1Z0P5_9BACT|nr:T9SS type A sorting domain-containing protein [Dyadobacter endophyticus]GGH43629.1 hypothetical protein GCM10007423_41150 [Dyadobacter endophyticus]